MFQFLSGLAYGRDARQRLDLFLPEKPGARLFVFLHGGGWRGGENTHYRALGELLANVGYAVALPNHRLAPEFPHPAAAEDVAAAIACVLRYCPESGIRADGIILGGHSSGAHLAALLAVHPGFLPSAGVANASLAGVIGISGVYDLAQYGEAGLEYLGPVFGEDAAAWEQASPLHYLQTGASLHPPPPFFLAYAERDIPGARAQAEAMAQALAKAGGSARVVGVPGRDHVTILSGVRSLLDPLAMGLAMFLREV